MPVQMFFQSYIKIEFFQGDNNVKYELIENMYHTNSIVEDILLKRGIQRDKIQNYLSASDKDINSPLLLDNIKEAASTLIKYIKLNTKAIVIVDADCDGMTSAALLINFLYDLFPTWTTSYLDYFIHQDKCHGLSDFPIEDNDYQLIICPDSSSNDYELHKICKDKNIQVIVLDHHNADYESKDAIVVNNQLSQNYPNKGLSGVGVTWQFCRYINLILNNEENIANKYLDLVALGMMADMSSLRDIETKYLIQKGFKEENIKNPFIAGMIEKNNFSLNKADYKSYQGLACTPMGAAFFIAPFVNAITRSGTIEEKKIVFESMLKFKAFEQILSNKRGHKEGETERLVEQALRICTNVKNRQTKAQDEGIELLEGIIKEKNLLNNKVLLFLLEPGQIDKNIAGLCANKLSSKYQHPCCILTKTTDEKGSIFYQGSARGCERAGVSNFKEICEQTKVVEYAAGHGGAFGLSIPFSSPGEEEIQGESILNFIDSTNEILRDMPDEPKYYVDYIFEENDISIGDKIIEIAEMNDFWGKDIDRAYVIIKFKITSENFKVMKSNTLKFDLPNNVSLIKFSGTDSEIEKFSISQGFIEVEAVCKCNENEWNGKITPQLIIEDYNILSQKKYLF